jgi:hypothetical protein
MAFVSSATLEYRTHHRVVAPAIDGSAYRPHWTLRTQLARLLEDGAIGRDEYSAGTTLAQWCEALGRGVKTSSWDVPIDSGGRRRGGVNETELTAARRLQAVAADLGREWFAVLEMTVIDDLPWARIGQALELSPKTAKTRAVEGLEMLAGLVSQGAVAETVRTGQ